VAAEKSRELPTVTDGLDGDTEIPETNSCGAVGDSRPVPPPHAAPRAARVRRRHRSKARGAGVMSVRR
jgi:hypothetical protein